MSEPISSIANAISEGFKLIAEYKAKKEVRRLKAAVEEAEQYIFCNEGYGDYAEFDAAKRTKYMNKFRTKFFKYNQG